MNRLWLAVFLCVALASTVGSAKDGFFDSSGARIRYVEEGTGEPVILLNGAGDSAAAWASSGVLDNLKQNYRVIAMDMRGHESGKPGNLDVIRLMDALGIGQAHIVGHSLGANIVSQLLTTHPERFSTATLSALTGATQVSAVQVPTLLIAGSADPFLADLRKLHALRPSMTLVVVEGATHSGATGIISKPEFIAALRELLSKGPDMAIAC